MPWPSRSAAVRGLDLHCVSLVFSFSRPRIHTTNRLMIPQESAALSVDAAHVKPASRGKATTVFFTASISLNRFRRRCELKQATFYFILLGLAIPHLLEEPREG
jgi:hypothetical protein